jgi:hypothetical protein
MQLRKAARGKAAAAVAVAAVPRSWCAVAVLGAATAAAGQGGHAGCAASSCNLWAVASKQVLTSV